MTNEQRIGRLVNEIEAYAFGPPIETASDAPLQVISLVCHRDLVQYLSSIRSFLESSGLACSVWTVSDGSLSAADERLIKSVLPRAHIFSINADHVAGLFPESASLRRFTEENPLGRKLAGALACAQAKNLMVLDSDVLFLRCPQSIVEWARTDEPVSLYCPDTRLDSCALDTASQRMLHIGSIPRFNSGLLCMRRQCLDAELAERVLKCLYAKNADSKWLWEQTVFAAMVSQSNHRELGEDYLFINDVNCNEEIELSSLTCVHYSGPSRQRFFTEGFPFLGTRRAVK